MWLVKDICGLILATLTWSLIFYAEFVVVYVLLWSYPWNLYKIFNLILFNILIFLALLSHMKSMLTDPGTIKFNPKIKNQDYLNSNHNINNNESMNSPNLLENQPSKNLKRVSNSKLSNILKETYCLGNNDDSDSNIELLSPNLYLVHQDLLNNSENPLLSKNVIPVGCIKNNNFPQFYQPVYRCLKCLSLKPDRAHHCSTCRKCINKMDHHCPWINNCVGEGNQKFFVLFNIYIMLSGFHALFIASHYSFRCLQSDWQDCSKTIQLPTSFLLTIFLIFEALLFTIFCCIMTGMQIHRILTDTTAIEALQGKHHANGVSSNSIESQGLTFSKPNDSDVGVCIPYDHESLQHNPKLPRKKRIMYNLKEVFGDQMSLVWFSPFHKPHFKSRLFKDAYGMTYFDRSFTA